LYLGTEQRNAVTSFGEGKQRKIVRKRRRGEERRGGRKGKWSI
jgi:hypothetical protein